MKSSHTQSEKRFDYLIVGAGLFGSVFAYEAKKRGYKCIVIDKRPHIGGNIYCQDLNGINIHRYGAHIFHTHRKEIWDYVNQFVRFNGYVHTVTAVCGGKKYSLPFNMNTFHEMWGCTTAEEANAIIQDQIISAGITSPGNLEEQAISMVGTDVYEKLIRGYTEKQWGRSCKELPASIIKRLPLRFEYNNRYFNDPYEGIPFGGYNRLIEGLLSGLPVVLGAAYTDYIAANPDIVEKTVYTGPIDQFFNYALGALEYRGLTFETGHPQEIDDKSEWKNSAKNDFQGCSVMNYTDRDVPFTRIIEHKHFQPEVPNDHFTIITREYARDWTPADEPYYPINDQRNNALFEAYKLLARERKDLIFGGRLGDYQYYDMDDGIFAALETAKEEFDRPQSGMRNLNERPGNLVASD